MARKGMIDFSQLEDLAEKWEKAGGKVEQLAESCLKAAHEAVTPPIVQDMTKHHRTGSTQESIVTKADVKWDGTKATIHQTRWITIYLFDVRHAEDEKGHKAVR